MRRDLDARDILMLREKIDLLRGRDMQHMDQRACLARDAQRRSRRSAAP